ncbi:MAG: response regulator transcription factor [Lautropia sp.]
MNPIPSSTSSPDPRDTPRLVYLVDDDEAVCDSMRWLLEGNGFDVRSFNSAEAFLAAFDPAPPACLVLDVRMNGMSGVELHDELLRRGERIPLIFMTGHGDVPMAVERMKLGAIDFLEKPFDDRKLCRVVANALAQAQASRVAQGERERDRQLLERLTPRERQVVHLIGQGRLNKQIADDLSISIKTVEAHRANIMEKFEVRTMAELMRRYLNAQDAERPAG